MLYLPHEKELMFFNANFEKGMEWYQSFFANCPPEALPGEVCPTYFSDESSPERIRDTLGDPKLAVILRRPSEQVASMHRLWQMRGTSTESLQEAIRTRPRLLHNIMYGTHLAKYEQVLGRGKVRVFFYDDLAARPKFFLEQVYSWLEVEPYFPSITETPANASRELRSERVERGIAWGGDLLRRNGALRVKALLNRTGLVAYLKRKNSVGSSDQSLPADVRDIIADATAADRKLLGSLIQKDLSEWI